MVFVEENEKKTKTYKDQCKIDNALNNYEKFKDYITKKQNKYLGGS